MQKSSGITLIELLTVLAILSLLSFSYPKVQRMLNYHQLDFYSRTVLIDFQYALRIAQNSGKSVSICISDNQINCSSTGDLNNWGRGWIIFYDISHDFIVKSGKVLRRRTFLNQIIQHRSDINIKNAIRFSGRRHFGSTAGTGLPNGSMTICMRGYPVIDLKISIFGESRLDKTNNITNCQ